MLQSIRDIGEYRAAAGDYQVIVDLAKDTALPDELLGERTLFVAIGSVDAGVNLGADRGERRSRLRTTGARRRSSLPAARLFAAELDVDRSYVYEQDRGSLQPDRLPLRRRASPARKSSTAPASEDRRGRAANDELRVRAEENTRTMLTSLLRSLGFTQISISFE